MLRKGITLDDTSFIYALPYPKGKTYKVIQGYFGKFTHKERAAIDFNLKIGDTVCAARGGIVMRVKSDGVLGGFKKKYRSHGNNIVIDHGDGTRSGYWHLLHNGAFVEVGDSVVTGQAIGLSGKTGYTLNPHLHFIVWRSAPQKWRQVLTRFATGRGVVYLKTFKKYSHPPTAIISK